MLFHRTVFIVAILAPFLTVVNGLNDTEDHHIHRQYKRGGGETCAFPYYEGMVAVQESGANAGWAMHFDQACDPGTWCVPTWSANGTVGPLRHFLYVSRFTVWWTILSRRWNFKDSLYRQTLLLRG